MERRLSRLALALGLLGALLAARAEEPQKPLRVERVSAVQLAAQALQEPGLAQACHQWHLSPGQVEQFFALSEIQDTRALHDSFYWLPCHLEGQLRDSRGQRWFFQLNPAATASTWQPDGARYFWGCRQQACAPLVLMMPDSGEVED